MRRTRGIRRRTNTVRYEQDRSRKGLGVYSAVGLLVIGIAEVLMFRKVWFVATFFTPIVWSGYILFVDSLIYMRKGESLIRTRTKEFVLMLPLSIAFWLIFEFYNLFIENWHYVHLPEKLWVRWLGYGWSFATIWPAILETGELIETTGLFGKIGRPRRISRRGLVAFIVIGAVCLIVPIIYPSRYLAAPVWVGFTFLLDPINTLRGRPSLLGDLKDGRTHTLWSLLLAGLICGVLWEFWNYWALAKWEYTVPILGDVKLFEMPILGYLGFPAFAVEAWVMYAFVRPSNQDKR